MRYTLLEPLRGLAALWVFCYHYQFSASFQSAFPGLHALLKIGDLGVPMFFVLSGFCILASARSAIRNGESGLHFLYRRVRRIYPPYWFSIAVVVLIPFVIEWLSSLKTGRYSPPAPTHPNYGYINFSVVEWIQLCTLSKVFASIPEAMTLEGKFSSINAVYWTLAIEVQFYLVVTFALGIRRYFYLVLFIVCLISLPFLFLPDSALVGWFFPYWPMFAIGILLYWLFEQGCTPSRLLGAATLPVAAVLTIGMASKFVLAVWHGIEFSNMVFSFLFGLFLFVAQGLDRPFVRAGLESRRRVIRILLGLAMSLGAMSYSLYLLHGRLQFLAMQFLRQVLPTNTVAFDAALILATCLACYLFYLVCERPFMGGKQRMSGKVASAAHGVAEAVVGDMEAKAPCITPLE